MNYRKIILVILCIGIMQQLNAQEETVQDTTEVFKKRVLESTEIDFLGSYYTQDGIHSSVGGGVGTESLFDYTPTVVVSVPLGDDDVLTIDAGISAYTSASSSNINPFDGPGGLGEDEDGEPGSGNPNPSGTPWLESSGESLSDALSSISATYSHSSDDRNSIWGVTGAFSVEYDYYSIGFGGSYARLFNEKNTEISAKVNVYLDQWKPIYATELRNYAKHGANMFNQGYFQGVNLYDDNGNLTTGYAPQQFTPWDSRERNSYSLSLGLSQILSKRAQISFFADIISQQGRLSTPYHRVYFADQPNYYVASNPALIPNYNNGAVNTGVFHLADNTEVLPDTRLKIPLGMRFNYYLNETFALRTYYRFYTDNWGISGHTASLEIPIKISRSFTLYPTYRYYTQTAADYFAPYNQHLSTAQFYTSDYDLSDFNSHQYGVGIGYTDIFTKFKIAKFGLKNFELRYNHYNRSDGLKANIISTGFKFVLD